MTRAASLHADAPADRRPAGAAALALQALSPAELAGTAEIVRTVIPPPDADGRSVPEDVKTSFNRAFKGQNKTIRDAERP